MNKNSFKYNYRFNTEQYLFKLHKVMYFMKQLLNQFIIGTIIQNIYI